jgi:adenosine deaminase
VCPLSNIALGFYKNLAEHPLKMMLDAGIIVTINSDDPAFFDGYIADNYRIAAEYMGLTHDDIITCARNSFLASFIDSETKKKYMDLLEEYVRNA